MSGLAGAVRRAVTFLKVGCAVFLFQRHVAELTVCVGPSMLPTLGVTGDVVVLEHVSPHWRGYQTGDVVVAVSPTDPRVHICKRVVAVAGETVPASSATLISNDALLVEETKPGTTPSLVSIQRGYVWLEGDNPENSTDSRHYGPVPVALVRGRVAFRVYPFHSAGAIPRQRPLRGPVGVAMAASEETRPAPEQPPRGADNRRRAEPPTSQG
ncbi:hypothetical protein CDCA_CDCA11G3258 [Cyanidium caldarium]|uniref:Mitochondrial inner membrane protease subunit n=1 Tax=Cyanidium caldarium TaxID=2771 RepID=A0AAV9IYQ1_CYACA|nr:hypothetical protein CDCA_CDCA11G3258 [Cyanidium caldarium]